MSNGAFPFAEVGPMLGHGAANDASLSATLDRGVRIGIVGAGPAGITAAATYAELGYRNVVVLEKNHRIGGRSETSAKGSDLGATAWVPGMYDELNGMTDRLGIERGWVAFPSFHSLKSGRKTLPLSPKAALRASEQAMRYMVSWQSWRGVDGPVIQEVSPELRRPWRHFARCFGFEDLGGLFAPTTEGFGYRMETPAMYTARYINPKCMVGVGMSMLRPNFMGGGSGIGYWKGGTQQIWERETARWGLDVRLGQHIQVIRRTASGVEVFVRGQSDPLMFDYIVLACQPSHLGDAMALTDEEASLFDRYRVFDYRTYEVDVFGLADGQAMYTTFMENLKSGRGANRPVVMNKPSADRPLAVIYVNADGSASDDAIIGHIREDLARVGGRVTKVHTTRRYDYMPHVTGEDLGQGFYERLWSMQGKNRTIGVGASHTFDVLPDVVRHAKHTVKTHVAQKLPGMQQFTAERRTAVAV